MHKGIILFLLSFFFLQFSNTQVYTGLSVKAGYCAQVPVSALVKDTAVVEEIKKVDPNLWDFGQVKQGLILKHDFIFKNETKDILKITNIHTSCGCTVSESAKKSLMPQESTSILVSFNSKGYVGPVTQFVYVDTDNTDLAIIKFTVKAEVVKEG